MTVIAGDTYAARALAGTLAGRADTTPRRPTLSSSPSDAGKSIDAYTGLPTVGAGQELGYAANTTGFTTPGNAAPIQIPGLSKTVTCGSGVIRVKFECYAAYHDTTAGAWLNVEITRDGTVIGGGQVSTTVNYYSRNSVEVRDLPGAGDHTYAVNVWSIQAGTIGIVATAPRPAWLSITN